MFAALITVAHLLAARDVAGGGGPLLLLVAAGQQRAARPAQHLQYSTVQYSTVQYLPSTVFWTRKGEACVRCSRTSPRSRAVLPYTLLASSQWVSAFICSHSVTRQSGMARLGTDLSPATSCYYSYSSARVDVKSGRWGNYHKGRAA